MAYHVQQRNEQIVQDVQSGATLKEVALKFRLSYNTVQKVMRRHREKLKSVKNG